VIWHALTCEEIESQLALEYYRPEIPPEIYRLILLRPPIKFDSSLRNLIFSSVRIDS
jgi:hypothetical protein